VKVFLISGKAEHGKDALADILLEELGEKAIKFPLADLVKFLAKYAGWNGEKDLVGRTLLQYIGTERTREECGYPTYWEDRMTEFIEILSYKYDYFIIPDCRFKSEMEKFINKFGDDAIDIRIYRPHHESRLTDEQKKHRSETDLDNFAFTYRICNDSTLDHIRKQARKIIAVEL
jgi:hypothetical protein